MRQSKAASRKMRARGKFTGADTSAGAGKNHILPEIQIFQRHIVSCNMCAADNGAFSAAPGADRHIVNSND